MRDVPGTNNIGFHKTDNRYNVSKSINGKVKHLGSYKTLIGALMIRDWCMANNWKPYPTHKSEDEKYIQYREKLKVYEIIKRINNKNEYFGRYHTLEDAKKWRDYFIEHDWNLNLRLIGTLNKNIYFKQGKYRIFKNLNGKDYYFGSFNTFEEAEQRVSEIRLKGWENVILNNERLIKTTTSNIVQLKNGKYEIIKNINGIKHTFGVFNTYEEAEDEVKLLRKCNWCLDALCESIDETINNESKWLDGVHGYGKTFFDVHPNGVNDIFSYSRYIKK